MIIMTAVMCVAISTQDENCDMCLSLYQLIAELDDLAIFLWLFVLIISLSIISTGTAMYPLTDVTIIATYNYL